MFETTFRGYFLHSKNPHFNIVCLVRLPSLSGIAVLFVISSCLHKSFYLSADCKDTQSAATCAHWKKNYGCSHSYVKPRCKKTCGTCGSGKLVFAYLWPPFHNLINHKHLNSLPPNMYLFKSLKSLEFVISSCWLKSFYLLGTCKDTQSAATCAYWKKNYGCSHSYVKPRCKKTCGTCGTGKQVFAYLWTSFHN